MSELRSVTLRALRDAGALIDDARFDRTRQEAAALARRHFAASVRTVGGDPAAVASSVGVSAGAMARWFGHGWQQAAGFAAYAGVRPARADAVARLGALFNLGVVLLDHLVDTRPERRQALTVALTPILTADGSPRAGATGDPEVELVAHLARAVVAGAHRLDGRPEDVRRLAALLVTMDRAERATVESRRGAARPGPGVWDALHAKSALPSMAVALLGLLGNPAADAAARDATTRAADLVGEAFWIVDDLADVRSDWDAGCWSRPLVLLSRSGRAPATGDEAVRLLLDTGLAAAEAQRLGQVLAELAALPGASDRALVRPVQAAVRSWVEEMA